MGEYGFRCEFCGKEVPFYDYVFLAENFIYDNENAYIAHQSCDDPDGDEILEVVETCGELKLVLVDEKE